MPTGLFAIENTSTGELLSWDGGWTEDDDFATFDAVQKQSCKPLPAGQKWILVSENMIW